jgi:two-component sensor histidine kinase
LLEWRERGGPAVRAPSRRGFGSRLLSSGLSAELGREAEMDYALEGLTCRVRAPVGLGPAGPDTAASRLAAAPA